MSVAQDLIAKAERRQILFGIVGLGYVGLPLAVELARAGYRVLGFDVNPDVVEGLNAGRSHVKDVTDAQLQQAMESGRFSATTDMSRLSEPDAISICVPTPLSKFKDPDVSFIVAATEAVKKRLRRGQAIMLESTTYPGTTREIMLPALESTGLKVGQDFFLAFSPERVDPGNPTLRDPQHAQGRRGDHRRLPRSGRGTVPAGHRHPGPGLDDRSGRAGQAAGEHLPERQHRPGERDGHRLRQAGGRRLGSDRGRGDQAVRLHEVPARPRAGRPLHSDRSRTISPGRCGASTTRPASSTWPAS